MSQDIFKRRVYSAKNHRGISILNSLTALNLDSSNILIRVNTLSLSADPNNPAHYNADDIDTFVFATSSNPQDYLQYTSPKNLLNLNVRDGGYF